MLSHSRTGQPRLNYLNQNNLLLIPNEVTTMFKILIEEMKLKNFSPNTINIYLYYNQEFLHFCNKSPREVSHLDIREYLLHCIQKQYSSSTINLAHNALAFYYGRILRKRVGDIPYQKREQRIRVFASPEEIENMINALDNTKHKLIISLLYASGVRVSELVSLKIEDIDLQKRLLKVRQGKGNKDRHTILSKVVVELIRSYLSTRPYESNYLFASSDGHITPRTVEEVLKQACQKARITNPLTPHSLRHSFATHHMEQGTKTKYIQQMLGHKDIRTTRIYEHISTKHLEKIRSPQDSNSF